MSHKQVRSVARTQEIAIRVFNACKKDGPQCAARLSLQVVRG